MLTRDSRRTGSFRMQPGIALSPALLMSALVIAHAAAATIPAAQAEQHIGERETLCGTIAGENTSANSRGTPTFINLDQPYPHQVSPC